MSRVSIFQIGDDISQNCYSLYYFMRKNGKYRFGLQKGVKIEFRGRIRNRDNQIVYGYICYFFEKSSFTLLKIPLIEFRVLTPF